MDETTNVPNLDAMPKGELMDFWQRHQRGRQTKALFPAGGTGTRTATGSLANYAANKATAMTCRLRGDIAAALVYERIADGIYQSLPDWARW